MQNRPNILFIIIDQLRADCLHGALAEHANLKNLHSLMNEAVTFQNHFSVTSPCGPSRASILTGQYAMNHRSVRNGTPLPYDKPNLATEVRKAGYLPFLYGYSDTSMDPRVFDENDPMLRSYEQAMPGFVEALEMRMEQSWAWKAYLKRRGYDVPDYPDIFKPSGDKPDNPAFYKAEDSDTAFLTDRVIGELNGLPTGWFAHVTYLRPHPPLVAPESYNKLVPPRSLPKPVGENSDIDHPFIDPAKKFKHISTLVNGFEHLEPTDENIAIMRSLYLGLANEVDHHIGNIIEYLKSSGQYDNTLIVITGDHGEMLGDYRLWGKMSYHDAAYHVPMIIRDPANSGPHGQMLDVFTESVDIAPTILDFIGQDIPDTMDGYSLMPFVRGEPPKDWRQYSFSELDFGDPVSPTVWQGELKLDSDKTNMAVLRTRQHTLVHFNGGMPQMLFDREANGEAVDISRDATSANLMLELSRMMLDHRMTHAEGRFARTMITESGVKRG